LLAALNYWNGLRIVDTTLSAQAQSRLNSLSGEIDRRLQLERLDLSRTAQSRQLLDVMSAGQAGTPVSIPADSASVPSDLKLMLISVLKGKGHCFRLAVFDEARRSLVQVDRLENARGPDTFSTTTGDPSLAPSPSVFAKREVQANINGTNLRFVVPIVASDRKAGSIVGDLNLDQLLAEASNVLNSDECR